MYRRALMIATCIVISLGVQNRVAQGHKAGTIGNVHYSSVVCTDLLKGYGKNEEGILGRCLVDVQLFEVLCNNPAGQEVAGESATQVVLVGEAEAQTAPGDKVQGRAPLEIEVSDQPLLLPEHCVNPNWHPGRAIVIQAEVTIEVFDAENINTFRTVLNCTLQEQYSVVNPPEEYIIGESSPTDPSPYDCIEEEAVHLD